MGGRIPTHHKIRQLRQRDSPQRTPMPTPSASFSPMVLHGRHQQPGISSLASASPLPQDARSPPGLENRGFQRRTWLSCISAMRWMRPRRENKMLHVKLHASQVKGWCRAPNKVRAAKKLHSHKDGACQPLHLHTPTRAYEKTAASLPGCILGSPTLHERWGAMNASSLLVPFGNMFVPFTSKTETMFL